MDPDANYREQAELYGSKNREDKERLRELVQALREWLQAGGFKPRGYVGPRWKPRKLSPAEKHLAKLQDFSAWSTYARWTLAMEKEFGREPNNWPAWGLAHLRVHVAQAVRR
jgi:predicted deacetylase